MYTTIKTIILQLFHIPTDEMIPFLLMVVVVILFINLIWR